MSELEIKRLPDAELEIMKELWAASGPLTRAQLEERLARRRWASTTLLALLGRLEAKGYVSREKQGKGYLYAAALAREDYLPVESRSALERMFGGSAKTSSPPWPRRKTSPKRTSTSWRPIWKN